VNYVRNFTDEVIYPTNGAGMPVRTPGTGDDLAYQQWQVFLGVRWFL
jgi:hypothetical protein